ncbi:acetyl-CoA carboxylase biotin carboxyl carrier protein [Thermoproteota archaeon]
MNLQEIKKLIKLVEESMISELHVEQKDLKVGIKKEFSNSAGPVITTLHPAYTTAAPVPPGQDPAAAQTLSSAGQPETAKSDPNLAVIKSQMVGTFYAAPNPEAQPYVKVGDKISKGKVVCIIEAMKLCNEIESEFSGAIETICVDNAQPVEYGQDLFVIRLG